jgi:hypothetical protein
MITEKKINLVMDSAAIPQRTNGRSSSRIVRIRNHEPVLAYVKRRTKNGKNNSAIILYLKRYIVREIYRHICSLK